MPSRNMFREASGIDMITPRAALNPESNVFDRAFNKELDMEEWDDWMRWEGNAAAIPNTLDRRESVASSIISSPERWNPENGSIGTDLLSTSYIEEAEFPFDDAPFEIDDSTNNMFDTPSISNTSNTSNSSHTDVRRAFRGFSTLTEVEERDLQDIAMPYRALSKIKIVSEPTSPASTESLQSPVEEVEPTTRKNRKRKSVTEDIPNALCQSRKRGHNAIEKRYRTNLNDKIVCLRDAIPSLSRHSSSDSKSTLDDSETEEMDAKTEQQKYGKAAILTRALDYIKHLESTTQRLGSEMDVLRIRVGAFEKLAMSGSPVMNDNEINVVRRPALFKTETLETIQADFKMLNDKSKSKSVAELAPRRRGSKQTKAS